ncbi:hypothetical protein ACQUW5_02975 [Legionella sp. CNM-1927-20]|uniref:hypothetical protein n=1 Tax=Legionella sp. CNM-1927-20 TaxID=3422221 RepID=UPI00403AD03A
MYKNTTYLKGHLLRRLIHAFSLLTPYLYYWHGEAIANLFFLSREQLVSLFVGIAITFELLRFTGNFNVYGQRDYEKRTISGGMWLIFSNGLVLLTAPNIGVKGAAIGAPIIWSACLCDIIMGELRIFQFQQKNIFAVGIIISSYVWIFSALFLGAVWWFLPFLIPAVVIAELINQPGLDDNFTMLFFPLVIAFFFMPWV